MKTFFRILLIGLLGGLNPGAFDAAATLEVGASVQIHATADFDVPLAAHGTWIEVGSLGRCWRPAGVAVEWRPYCYGTWVWTDCGWYWESDEPWAWACYHYGYWADDPEFGWVWVPGIEWGPAWVSWRVGGGFIGWAPLPPPGFSVSIAAPSLFVFVDSRHFVEPIRPSRVIVNNTTIINQTTVINNIRRENRTFSGGTSQRVVINDGPGVDPIQKATGKTVSRVPIRTAVRQTPVPSTLKHEPLQPTGRQTQPTVHEQPRPSPAQNQPPGRISEPAREQTAPPDTPPKERVAPPAEHPARPEAPPATRPDRGHGSDKEPGHGPDKERGRGHDKDAP